MNRQDAKVAKEGHNTEHKGRDRSTPDVATLISHFILAFLGGLGVLAVQLVLRT